MLPIQGQAQGLPLRAPRARERQEVAPRFILRAAPFGSRVLAIQVPASGVFSDVFADSLQAFVVADDVFVVVALPESLTEAGPPSRLHAACIPHRRDGLERADHITQRRGNPCGCPYIACYRSRGRHKACPYPALAIRIRRGDPSCRPEACPYPVVAVRIRRGNPCGCPYIARYRSRGRHKTCPYVLLGGEEKDGVDVVGHEGERIQMRPPVPHRQGIPLLDDHVTRLVRLHLVVYDLSKQGCAALRANGNEIRALLGVVIALQANATSTRLRCVWHLYAAPSKRFRFSFAQRAGANPPCQRNSRDEFAMIPRSGTDCAAAASAGGRMPSAASERSESAYW